MAKSNKSDLEFLLIEAEKNIFEQVNPDDIKLEEGKYEAMDRKGFEIQDYTSKYRILTSRHDFNLDGKDMHNYWLQVYDIEKEIESIEQNRENEGMDFSRRFENLQDAVKYHLALKEYLNDLGY